jgi:hypothetical protein
MQLHPTHPYDDIYTLTTQYNEVGTKYPPEQLEQNLLATWSASTQPPGVLITYGTPEATSDNFAFLA